MHKTQTGPCDKPVVARLNPWPLLCFIALGMVQPSHSAPATLQVGPERTLKLPSAAAELARNGDVIQIDAGIYRNDYTVWHQDDLTIRGMEGMAHMHSEGEIPNGKAIWIIAGKNTTVENVEFSGAKVSDTNGAGIRHEGGDLTLYNTFFHNNEFSVLTGVQPDASLEISSSRFWYQKRNGTFSHGIYVGKLKRFTLIGSHIKGTDRGHQVKSRALENFILYNRIEDVPEGNSSRLIDLPNCGLSFIIGNDLHQGEYTQNVDAIGYGAEACDDREPQQRKLFVIHNTFVNDAWNGTLVKNHAGADALVANNLLLGRGFFLLGAGSKRSNQMEPRPRKRLPDWTLAHDSKAIDKAITLQDVAGISLVPKEEFSPPTGTKGRIAQGTLDIGSREIRSINLSGQ